MRGEATQEAPSPVQTPASGEPVLATYSILSKAQIRAGFDVNSDKVGGGRSRLSRTRPRVPPPAHASSPPPPFPQREASASHTQLRRLLVPVCVTGRPAGAGRRGGGARVKAS